MYVFLSVCVCERGRERERKVKTIALFFSLDWVNSVTCEIKRFLFMELS